MMPIADMFTQYYSLDFVAIICMFVSIWLLGNRRREGFIFGMIGTLCFIAFNALVFSIPGMVGNLVLLWLNIRGWQRWVTTRGETGKKALEVH